MTKRELYVQELNRLAAIYVMKWRRSADGIRWLIGTHGAGHAEIATYLWSPCGNPSDMFRVIDQILNWRDFNGTKPWEMLMQYEQGGWIVRFYRDTNQTLSYSLNIPLPGYRDVELGVAVACAAIAEGGGRLPEHVEKGDEHEQATVD